jgi:hypothetical protein
MAMHTPINLAGKVYKPSFIVLDGQGLDVILGMGCLKEHKALLHTTARVVHLDSPIHGIDVIQLSSSCCNYFSSSNNQTEFGRHTCAHEFLDVFPNDLPRMPSDQDMEFTIELQLGTTPISI